jgi:hypothetical protein
MRKILAFCLLLPACLATESKPVTCNTDNDCQTKIGTTQGVRCDLTQHACVCDGTAYPGCDKFVDGGANVDGPGVSDVPVTPADVVVPVPVDGATDVQIADVTVPDTRVPDAAGTCGTNLDCTDPTKAFCVAGVCVGCQAAGVSACVAPTPACDLTSGKCVGCTADAQCTVDPSKGFCVAGACAGCGTPGATGCTARTDGKTTCATTGTSIGQCVECAADTQCTADPAKGFCVGNACTGCNTTGATGCSTRADGKTVCAITGASTGQCVECSVATDCKLNAAKGFCVGNACTGCTAAICAARTDGKNTCATTGTAAGQCVECMADAQCTQDPTKSFCVANACAGCGSAASGACSTRAAATPVCGTSGACVECNASADCTTTTKPICTSNACVACTADSQCATKLGATGNPGVCLSNIDGHCATDADTIYVGTIGTATCSDTATNAGSAQAPYCTAKTGIGAAKSKSKPLVLLTGTLAVSSPVVSASVTVVGKSGAVITPESFSDGITINSGEVYLRNLTVKGSASTSTGIGINAAPISGSTVTLHMDTCAVTGNPGGGILLNGAAFDIKNATISGNGPNGSFSWGGIFVQSLPTSGPTTLNLVSITANPASGLSCAGTIQGTGVLATGNTSVQIATGCSITTGACTVSSSTCGAQSTPQ